MSVFCKESYRRRLREETKWETSTVLTQRQSASPFNQNVRYNRPQRTHHTAEHLTRKCFKRMTRKEIGATVPSP